MKIRSKFIDFMKMRFNQTVCKATHWINACGKAWVSLCQFLALYICSVVYPQYVL